MSDSVTEESPTSFDDEEMEGDRIIRDPGGLLGPILLAAVFILIFVGVLVWINFEFNRRMAEKNTQATQPVSSIDSWSP